MAGGRIVVVGTAGLRWDDISAQTPALTTLLGNGAVAAGVVRSREPAACPIDGWLAVSAGRRADDAREASSGTSDPGCRQPTVTATATTQGATTTTTTTQGATATTAGAAPGTTPGAAAGTTQGAGDAGNGTVAGPWGGAAVVDRWQELLARAAAAPGGARPGRLGDLLQGAHTTVAAIGPGAAVAVADSGGAVAHYWPGLASTSRGGIDPDADVQQLTDQLTAAFALSPGLVVVDVGAIREVPGTAPGQSSPPSRSQQLEALDDPTGQKGRIGAVLAQLPDDATIYLASLADSGSTAHLQLLAAAGRGIGSGLLTSGSTRQDGLVATTDLLPTIAAGVGLGTVDAVDGAPIRVTPGGDEVSHLERVLDLDESAPQVARLVLPFFVIVVLAELAALVGLVALARLLRLRAPVRERVLGVVQVVAVAGAALPVATFLANLWPWWRAGSPLFVLLVAAATAVVPIALLALLGPWRRHPLGPPAVVGAVTAITLAADVATGSQLSLVAVIGGQPLVGGRYFGLSNPAFALYAMGALLATIAAAGWLAPRQGSARAGLAVAGVGLVAAVVDVWPGLGADVGGAPAILPAFAYLALRVAGVRVTWRRALLVGAGTLLLVTAICLADWLRPAADRTHLGRFVQTVLDGGGADVLQRKLSQNAGMLAANPATAFAPVLAAIVVWALVRPERFRLGWLAAAYRRLPLLRPGLAAAGVLLLIGFLANDSGTAIPPVAALLLLPLLLAVSARAILLTQREELAAAVAFARTPPPRPRR